MRYTYTNPQLERERDAVLRTILDKRGMCTFLARELGISKAAVAQWYRSPSTTLRRSPSYWTSRSIGCAGSRARGPRWTPDGQEPAANPPLRAISGGTVPRLRHAGTQQRVLAVAGIV